MDQRRIDNLMKNFKKDEMSLAMDVKKIDDKLSKNMNKNTKSKKLDEKKIDDKYAKLMKGLK